MNQAKPSPTSSFQSLRRKIIATGLVCSLSLSGCAGIFDPHPRASEMTDFRFAPSSEDSKDSKDSEQKSRGLDFHGDLPKAIDDANAQRQAYLAAGDNQSYATNFGALSLVGASAAALFLGVTSTSDFSRDAITALGIGGAGLLGLGSFYLSKPRQRLYYGAAQAISCSMIAMRPFLMTKGEYKELSDAVNQLSESVGKVTGTITSVESATAELRQVAPGNSLIVRAESEVTATKSDRDNAVSVLRDGANLERSIDGAGAQLRLRVKHIMDTVDIEITKTEPTLDSLLPTLGGLSGVAGQIVPGVSFEVPETGAPTSEVRAQVLPRAATLQIELQRLIDELANKRVAMLRAATKVQRFVDAANSLIETSGSIEACKPPTAEPAFSVVPADSTIEVTAPATILFEINSGSGVPSAALAGPKLGTSTVELKNGTYQATVTIDKDASGETTVVFRNGARTEQKAVKIKVKAKKNANIQNTGNGPGTPPGPDAMAVSALQAMAMQAHFRTGVAPGLAIDGKVGPETRQAIAAFRQANGLAAGNQIDEPLWRKLVEALPTGRDPGTLVGPQTDAERQMAAPRIDDIRRLLDHLTALGVPNVPQVNEFSVEARRAILAFQKAAGLPETGTLAAPQIVAAIRSCTALPCS